MNRKATYLKAYIAANLNANSLESTACEKPSVRQM